MDTKPDGLVQFGNRFYRVAGGHVEKWKFGFIQDKGKDGKPLFEKTEEGYVPKGKDRWVLLGRWSIEYFKQNIIWDGVTNRHKKEILELVVSVGDK